MSVEDNLATLMSAAIAEDAELPPEEGTEKTEVKPETPEGEKKPEKVPTPPVVAKPEEDKAAARFAALARENKRVLEAKAQLSSQSSQLQAREATLTKQLADIEGVLADPAKLFDHLEKTLGIKSMEDLAKHAKGVWERPKNVDPKTQPLTREEFERLEQQRAAQSRANEGIRQLLTLVNDKDGETYPHAALIYSDAEAIELGNRIAGECIAKGVPFEIEDIAAALNELALKDKRMLRIQKRTKPAQETPKIAPAGAPQDTIPAKERSQAPSLSNDVSSQRTPPPPAKRETYKERVDRLSRG